MNISEITNTASLGKIGLTPDSNKPVVGDSFQKMLSDAIGSVNKTQVDAYDAMEGIATGKVTNLQSAVQKIEEAELSLRLSLEVKNKALSAYKEIMRMQV